MSITNTLERKAREWSGLTDLRNKSFIEYEKHFGPIILRDSRGNPVLDSMGGYKIMYKEDSVEARQADAFRHAYSSAITAKEKGVVATTVFGYLNEWIGKALADDNIDDSIIKQNENKDLWNNDKGFGILVDNPYATEDEISSIVARHLRSGMLIIDPTKDNRIYNTGFGESFLNSLGDNALILKTDLLKNYNEFTKYTQELYDILIDTASEYIYVSDVLASDELSSLGISVVKNESGEVTDIKIDFSNNDNTSKEGKFNVSVDVASSNGEKSVDGLNVSVDGKEYQVSEGSKEILTGLVQDPAHIDNDDMYTLPYGADSDLIFIDKEATAVGKDGITYKLIDLVNQVQTGIENTAKFIITQASEFTGNYGSYLADNKENIIGDILGRVLLGESLEEAMKAVAEVWGINALLNNDSSNALISKMLGISPDMISNGVENGYFTYVRDSKGDIIKDAQGQPLLELTGEGEATFAGATGSEWMYGAKTAMISFATTSLIAIIRGDALNSEEYTEAGVRAAAQGVLATYGYGGPQVAAIMAIMDSSITAIENADEFDSDGWQNLGTSTASAVATAVISYTAGAAIGAKIGAAIGGSIGGPIGMVAGAVIGTIIGAVLYQPLSNYFHDQFEAMEKLYDAIEDVWVKLDFSLNNIEESIKEIVEAIGEDIEAVIKLPIDIGEEILRLVGLYTGKEYDEGEYASPADILNELRYIQDKEDGTGKEIFGVGHEGVLLRASKNGVDDIYGSKQSDVMVGNDQVNVIVGSFEDDNGVDNDYIEGRGGDDVIIGKSGDDLIFGGLGNDIIDGGDDNDRVYGDDGDDEILGGDGLDVIEGGNGIDKIDAGSSNDEVYGGEGDDVVVGGMGDDNIYGDDLLNTKAGNDLLYGDDGDDSVFGGMGDDIIDGGDGNDYIDGGAGNDNLLGDLGDDGIFAGEGVDIIDGGFGNDLIDAGGDADLVLAGTGADLVYGNDGDDEIYGELGNDFLMGGDGDDLVVGGEGDDVLSGDMGDDILDGGVGDDLYLHTVGSGISEIYDEAGSDIVRVFGVASEVKLKFYQVGNDLEIKFAESVGESDVLRIKDQFGVAGSVAVEKLRIDNGIEIDLASLRFGSNGVASYNKGTYEEVIESEALQGYSRAILNAGRDYIIENPYSSWYNNNYDLNTIITEIDYEQYNDVQIRSDKKKRSDFGGHYKVYYKYYEENLYGTSGNDKIVGNWWAENIYGYEGDDVLNGNDGNDTIYGGADNDLLFLGAGNDSGYGEAGSDKAYGGAGNDTIIGGTENDTIYGESGNDILDGGNADDVLFGGIGNDSVNGGDGNDILVGEEGDDRLNGQGGNDYIYAGDGNDAVFDNAGNDVVFLGKGSDLFVASFNMNMSGIKTIKDFNPLEDKLIINRLTTAKFVDWVNNGLIYQEANNVVIEIGDNKIILENINLSQLSDNNFATSLSANESAKINSPLNDVILGTTGNDNMVAGDGDDIIDSGNGNDIINGGSGNDIYFYNLGGGNDIISDTEGLNKIKFGNGISLEDIKFERIANDLKMTVGTSGSITIKDYHLTTGSSGKLDFLEFSNGRIKDISQYESKTTESLIKDLNAEVKGADYINDTIYLKGISSKVYSLGGDDTIYYQSGARTGLIDAGDGNDIIYIDSYAISAYGGNGNDTIHSGFGNDSLYGGNGDDTYVFRYNAGTDYIYETAGNDTILFDKGIRKEDINLWRVGTDKKDLSIDVRNSDAQLIIKGYFSNNNSRVEKFKFADGSELDLSSLPVYDKDNVFEKYLTSGSKIVGKAITYTSVVNSGKLVYVDSYYADSSFIYSNIVSSSDRNVKIYGEHTMNNAKGEIFGGKDIIGSGTLVGIGYGTLTGDNTNDILRSKGNEILTGGAGIDTFVIDKPSRANSTTIKDFVPSSEKIDLTSFNDDISSFKDLVITNVSRKGDFARTYNDIHINIGTKTIILENLPSGSISAKNFIGNASKNSVIKGDQNTNIINDTSVNDEIYGFGGNDTINLKAGGSDFIDAGDGDDIINIYGNATIVSGLGKDRFNIVIKDGLTTVIKDFDSYRDTIAIAKSFSINGEPIDFLGVNSGNNSGIDPNKIFEMLINPVFLDMVQVGNNTEIILSNNQKIILENIKLDSISESNFIGNISLGRYSLGDETIYSDIILPSDNIVKIYGNDGNDVIFGKESKDFIYGENGDDAIYGEKGDDIIYGGKDNDKVNGGDGSDTYIYNKGDGNDTISDSAGNDTIIFGEGINKVDVYFQRVSKVGNASYNDLLIGFRGGQDSIIISDYFNPTNTASSNYKIETLKFTDGSIVDLSKYDSKISSFGSVVEFDLEDIDPELVKPVEVVKVIYGTSGNDKLLSPSGLEVEMHGDGGNDIFVIEKTSSLRTVIKDFDSYAESIDLSNFNDVIENFNDVVISEVLGGVEIRLSSGHVVMIEGVRAGELVRENFKGNASKEAGIDWTLPYSAIVGNNENENIIGSYGRDRIYGSLGNDTIDGGDGVDLIDYSKSAMQVIVYLDNYISGGADIGRDSLNNIEGAIGGNIGDILYDNMYNNYIDGGLGNDFIGIRGGEDLVYGGGGNDVISLKHNVDGSVLTIGDFDTKSDRIDLGLFNNIVDNYNDLLIKSEGENVVLNFGTQTIILKDVDISEVRASNFMGDAKFDEFYIGEIDNYISGGDDIETTIGSYGNDVIYGSRGSDIIDGGEGIDTLDYGSSLSGVLVYLNQGLSGGIEIGRDEIRNIENVYTGNGGDTIYDNEANNYINSGGGDDLINIIGGNDVLSTGVGSDKIAIRRNIGSAEDIDNIKSKLEITDFNIDYDRIDLSKFTTSTTTADGDNKIDNLSELLMNAIEYNNGNIVGGHSNLDIDASEIPDGHGVMIKLDDNHIIDLNDISINQLGDKQFIFES